MISTQSSAVSNAGICVDLLEGSLLTVGSGNLVASLSSGNFGLRVDASQVNVTGTITCSTNNQTNIVVQNRGIVTATGVITASASTNGAGILLQSGASLSAAGLSLSDNVINLSMISAQCTLSGTSSITVPKSTSASNVTLTDSIISTTATFTVTNTGTNIPLGVEIRGSKASFARFDITNNHTVPLRIYQGSNVSIIGPTTSLQSGGASTTSIILVENSVVNFIAMTVSGALGVGNPCIRIFGASTGKLDTVACNTGADNGLQIDTGSNVKLRTITGTGNTLNGLYVTDGANVQFATGTMTVTGTAGNCKVGVNATKTWANMDTGQIQHINDVVFPGGVAATLTTVSTNSFCTPGL